MSDNVQNVTHEILKSIQAGIVQLNDRFDRLDERIDAIDAGMRKDRRNVAGMLVMMRATAGDFDTGIAEVEERVKALDSRR